MWSCTCAPILKMTLSAYQAKRLSNLRAASQLEHPILKRTICAFSETVLEVKSCPTAGAPDFWKGLKYLSEKRFTKVLPHGWSTRNWKGPKCFSVKRFTILWTASQLEQVLLFCWSNLKCCCLAGARAASQLEQILQRLIIQKPIRNLKDSGWGPSKFLGFRFHTHHTRTQNKH